MKQGCFSLYVEQDGIGSFGANSLEGDREKSRILAPEGRKGKAKEGKVLIALRGRGAAALEH